MFFDIDPYAYDWEDGDWCGTGPKIPLPLPLPGPDPVPWTNVEATQTIDELVGLGDPNPQPSKFGLWPFVDTPADIEDTGRLSNFEVQHLAGAMNKADVIR